jgi:hypothetical protein
MDSRVIVSPSRLDEFHQQMYGPSMRILNEMYTFYEGIELG